MTIRHQFWCYIPNLRGNRDRHLLVGHERHVLHERLLPGNSDHEAVRNTQTRTFTLLTNAKGKTNVRAGRGWRLSSATTADWCRGNITTVLHHLAVFCGPRKTAHDRIQSMKTTTHSRLLWKPRLRHERRSRTGSRSRHDHMHNKQAPSPSLSWSHHPDLLLDGTSVTDGFDDIAGAGLSLSTEHGRSFRHASLNRNRWRQTHKRKQQLPQARARHKAKRAIESIQ